MVALFLGSQGLMAVTLTLSLPLWAFEGLKKAPETQYVYQTGQLSSLVSLVQMVVLCYNPCRQHQVSRN